MAPLFSKVDLNKVWHDVQNEESLICAKFGKDLFNISKVIVSKVKQVAQFFLLTVYMHVLSKSFTWYPSKLNAVMILRRSHSTAIRPTQNKYIPIFCGKMRHRHGIVIITLTEYILRIHTASFFPSVL